MSAMRVGLATDHAAFSLKERLRLVLSKAGFSVTDFGAYVLNPTDDFTDFAIPLAHAVAQGEVERGIALCGSGVGVCVVANKVPGVRACLIHDCYSAHQGVEHDDVNILCIGGRVIAFELAWDLVQTYLNAKFQGGELYKRRLDKIRALEARSLANGQQSVVST